MTPERFDIYDNQQKWIGTAPRNEVHAKGYWHRSFHCWIVRDEGDQRMILFQRRRDIKDTFPGYYDITATGHLTAGEQAQDASRELEEELGVHTSFEALTYLFTAERQPPGRGPRSSFPGPGDQRSIRLMPESAAGVLSPPGQRSRQPV